jgi:hypothetical protein
MKTLRIAVAAALLLTSGSAFAQSASDAQCLLLSNAYATQAKDDNGKKMAEGAFYFYLGRISQTATAAQLKTLLDAQMKTLTQEAAPKLMSACANAVADKFKLVDSVATPAKPAAAPQQQKPPQGR